jgi:hypothetical protein
MQMHWKNGTDHFLNGADLFSCEGMKERIEYAIE